jgi:hypothetical protein
MEKNVTIPFSLFTRILDFFEFMDTPEYTAHHWQEYDDILSLLRKKKDRIALRDTYTELVHAEDDDFRHDARIRYLQHKRAAKGSL